MKQILKSYFVLTSKRYRLLLVGVPVAILIFLSHIEVVDYFMTTLLITVIYTATEIILDYGVFGGVAVKGETQLEYIKSSGRGMKMMERGLVGNMVRQFLTLVLLFFMGALVFYGKGGEFSADVIWLLRYVAILFVAYLVITATLTVTRFFDGINVNMVASAICFFPMTAFIYLVGINAYVMLPVLVVLAIISSVLGVRLIMKQVKESYYDGAI